MKSHHEKPVDIRAAVITISSSRTMETDTSGKTIIRFLEEDHIPVLSYGIVKDSVEEIRRQLFQALKDCNCIIMNGGTGLSPDDCTIEAVAPLLEKRIEGFGEIFRLKGLQDIGTATILSRAIAGTCGGGVIFCIPGSTPAVSLAMKEIIIPELRHILSHVQGKPPADDKKKAE
ncbi:MAG: MogA/MoaB family molybdenum cofactor biosynthesis protein [Methanolinea sp.]|nr:MogA/MoaB family molybdenum cofactor biosynthesis protein [Methanolinea sp.]